MLGPARFFLTTGKLRMHDKYTEAFKHASHPHKMISPVACIRTEVIVDGIVTVYNHNTTNQLTLTPRTLEKYENRKESKTIHIFPHHLFNTLNNEIPCCPTKKEQNSSLHMSTERINAGALMRTGRTIALEHKPNIDSTSNFYVITSA